MRFVRLSEAELLTLQEGHKNGSQFQFRNRCQCLVFSDQGRTVPELAQFFCVNPITVYGWFDRWESSGIAGLMNKSGRGRKPILSLQNPTHIESVKTAVRKNAQSLKAMVAELETTLETEMSVDTVKRFLKNLVSVTHASAPRSSHGRWVPERQVKERALKSLWQLFKAGSIDLYFAAESTFSMILPCRMRGRKRARKSKSFRNAIKRSICSAASVLIMWRSLIKVRKTLMPRF